ncbi:MAG TPA: hypothetical protein VJ418_08000 [Streptosporangiaceae bacterium]|nr:hypothetical protein [Streptosporangiaceae bacterium]
MSRQLYLPGTAILITRFMTPDGVGEVRDFMPVITGKAAERHRLVRVLTVPRGAMRFAMDLQPRFDYGRQAHTLTISDRGAMFEEEGSGGMRLTLHTVGRGGAGNGDGEGVQVRNQGDGLQATWTLGQGEATGVVLESMGGRPRRLAPSELARMFDTTSLFWHNWLNRSTYTGRWREIVSRSAVTLKLMTYAPHRSSGRGAHGRTARADRRRAQLGLSLHLDQRRLLLHLRAAARSWLFRRGRCSRVLGPGPRDGAGRHWLGPAQDHVPRRRLV